MRSTAPAASKASAWLAVLVVFTSFVTLCSAFHSPKVFLRERHHSSAIFSSWGKRKKEFVNEEFAREGGDRRGFDAYELQERSDFLAKMRADKKKFLKKKNEEYLEIARMAGITDQSGDGIDPMGIFVAEDEVDFNDDIDVRVQWDGQTEERRRVNMPDEYEEDIDVQ